MSLFVRCDSEQLKIVEFGACRDYKCTIMGLTMDGSSNHLTSIDEEQVGVARGIFWQPPPHFSVSKLS